MERRIFQAKRFLFVSWIFWALLMSGLLILLENLLDRVKGQNKWIVITFALLAIISFTIAALLPGVRRFGLLCPSCGRHLLDMTIARFESDPTCPRCHRRLS